MKKERGLMHTTDMVQAILANRKTETRRTRGLNAINSDPDFYKFGGLKTKNRLWDSTKEENPNLLATTAIFLDPIDCETKIKCPYGNVGDRLYVREKWAKYNSESFDQEDIYAFFVLNDGTIVNNTISNVYMDANLLSPWKPSIHMPKEAARIWLEITDIKIERLHDITDESALAEGIESISEKVITPTHYKNYLDSNSMMIFPKGSYRTLWDSINAKPNKTDLSWKVNPWVWVIKYKVISKTGKNF